MPLLNIYIKCMYVYMYYGYSRINIDSRLYRFTRTLSHVVKINC